MNTPIIADRAYIAAPKHVVAIVNPNSGMRRRSQRVIQLLRTHEWGSKITIFETVPNNLEGHREAIAFAREHGADRILVSGGDGTLMETLTTMLESGSPLPIYMVPSGTGNIVANDLNMPRRLLPAIRHSFSEGIVRLWDVGRIETTGQVFALRASAGHDALALASTDSRAKQRWGTFAYLLPALMELYKIRMIDFTLTIDDDPPFTMQGITAFVAVTSRMIGAVNFVLSREIHPDDGVLHVGVIHSKKLLQNLPSMVIQKALDVQGMLSVFPARHRVRIDANPIQMMQVDGELMDSKTPLIVQTIPHTIPFVIPLR
jgi:diacylglycerol kinase family enzyme